MKEDDSQLNCQGERRVGHYTSFYRKTQILYTTIQDCMEVIADEQFVPLKEDVQLGMVLNSGRDTVLKHCMTETNM